MCVEKRWKPACLFRMKKALGMCSLADTEDTNGNGAVYIVTMTITLLSLNLMMKKCEAETEECLTHNEVKGG